MKCKACGCPELRIIDKRYDETKRAFKRRRECKSCRFRWNTYEITEYQLEENIGATLRLQFIQEAMTREV